MNKKMILQFFAMLALLVGCTMMSGCTTPQQESDIPWNTPQSWESQGPLGSMLNGGY